METLSTILRHNDVETVLRNARLTLDWPDGEEKRAEAERQIRMAMYRAALGQISNDERDRILDILRPCCPALFTSQSLPPHEPQFPVED